QMEPRPVTRAWLFEPPGLAPKAPLRLVRRPPLVIVRRLRAPWRPTVVFRVVRQTEPGPLMIASFARLLVVNPISPRRQAAVAPLLITNRLNGPLLPMMKSVLMSFRKRAASVRTSVLEAPALFK